MSLRVAVITGLIASFLQLWPTGDGQGAMIARYQPATLAAMEGLFQTQHNAPVAILGQPDVPRRTLDNPLNIPGALSFLTYRNWAAEVNGLDSIPESDWPDKIPLVYFAYHIMVGLGTMFIVPCPAPCETAGRLNRHSDRLPPSAGCGNDPLASHPARTAQPSAGRRAVVAPALPARIVGCAR